MFNYFSDNRALAVVGIGYTGNIAYIYVCGLLWLLLVVPLIGFDIYLQPKAKPSSRMIVFGVGIGYPVFRMEYETSNDTPFLTLI